MKLRNGPGSTRNIHVLEDGVWVQVPLRPGRTSRELSLEELDHPLNQKKVGKGLLREVGRRPAAAPVTPAVPMGGGEEED